MYFTGSGTGGLCAVSSFCNDPGLEDAVPAGSHPPFWRDVCSGPCVSRHRQQRGDPALATVCGHRRQRRCAPRSGDEPRICPSWRPRPVPCHCLPVGAFLQRTPAVRRGYGCWHRLRWNWCALYSHRRLALSSPCGSQINSGRGHALGHLSMAFLAHYCHPNVVAGTGLDLT